MIERLLRWHARQVATRPAWVGSLLFVTTLGAVFCLPRLEIESDLRALLPPKHPSIRLMRALDTGAGTRTMLLLLRGEDLASALPALEESLRASPFLERVDARRGDWLSEPETGAAILGRAPPVLLERLAQALEPRERREAIQEAKTLLAQDPVAGRELLLRDPLGLRWLLAEAEQALLPPGLDPNSDYLLWPARQLALVRVRGTREPFDVDFSNELLADLEQRIGGRSWDALGGYDVARRDAARIRADMTRSLLWSIPLLILVLALSTRSFWVPHLYVLPTLMAVLWALGFGGLLLGPLTPLAVSSAAILMGLGIDFCIHYLDRYRQERRDVPHNEAVERAHLGTGRALLLSMATTVSAFLAIALGSFPGLAGFGLLLTLGLVGSWVAALSLLPILACRMHAPDSKRAAAAPSLTRVWRGLRQVVDSRAGRPLAIAFAMLALCGWGLAIAGGLRFDADPGFLRPPAERFSARTMELDAALGASPLGLKVLIPEDTDPDEVASGLERLKEGGSVARIAGDFEAYPGARQRGALSSFEARSEGWRAGAVQDLGAAGLRVESFTETLDELAATLRVPTPSLPAPTFDWEGRRYRSVLLHAPRTHARPSERAELRAQVEGELGPGLLFVDSAGLGDALGPLLASDLTRSLALCTLVVILVVGSTLRRLRPSLAALCPVFCGLGLTLGVLVLSGDPLHPGNLLALPLILGLGVDDGIHMVLRWREGGADPLLTTGPSVWRTTITTLIGFGSLMFAASPAIASLGALAAFGALACFLATVLVTPVMLAGYADSPPPDPSS